MTREGLRINHLLFADDSLLFCRTNLDEWNEMQAILEMYERSLGYALIRKRHQFFFSKNNNMEVWAHLKSIAGMGTTQSYENYRGLLALIGKS